jgi:hypothetical protein
MRARDLGYQRSLVFGKIAANAEGSDYGEPIDFQKRASRYRRRRLRSAFSFVTDAFVENFESRDECSPSAQVGQNGVIEEERIFGSS